MKEFTGFEQRRLDVSLSADGERLASCGFGGDVIVWDFDSGEVVFRFSGLAGQTESVALNQNGSQVVVGSDSHRDDRRLVVLDVDQGEIKQPIAGHAGTINWVRYSPDHRWLVTASRDQTVRLWDAASGDEIGVLRAHHEWVWAGAFLPDGERLLTGGVGIAFDDRGADFALRSWDLRRLKQR
ncbi:hypothetical protein U8335_15120 [Roseiconus lacunae]|uniref:WD40 repeat domain-containing protein n=1 Tax=Roseiconus lacunae TaxID=2605694 RepID=UPI003089CA4D|nr:hypothetical protein U8335_15120 [Stieleria sp. HD01]